MKKSVIAFAVIVLALSCVTAFAQNVPLRGFGLLAMNSDSANGLANPGRSALIETPDGGGGGSLGARALRGADGGAAAPRPAAGAAAADALPPKAIGAFDDPSQPAAPTPKRPSYRWQSLVPGAIK